MLVLVKKVWSMYNVLVSYLSGREHSHAYVNGGSRRVSQKRQKKKGSMNEDEKL